MIIKSAFLIDGYLPEYQGINTTSHLYFDTERRNYYVDVYDDKTEKLITRIYVDDILNALCDIIR